jgi:ADP-ribose pyrophosphatase YjhB (NUDIX family)
VHSSFAGGPFSYWMASKGPYLWLGPYAPPTGFRTVPYGAMCLGVFVFVRRGNRVLLGKVRDHPAWLRLTGEDAARVRSDIKGWKLPARQLKLGEDPRDAARQIGEEVLGLKGLKYGEPRVEVEFWKLGRHAAGPPARRKMRHFDVWFFVDARLPAGRGVDVPPWFSDLAWKDTAKMAAKEWSRQHEDVAARWRKRGPQGRVAR